MPSKKKVINLWRSIWGEIEPWTNPPVRLVFNNEWKEITGQNLGKALGRASREEMIIGIRYRGLDLGEIKENLWHELGHILFPSKPHWWIECYGEIMSRHGNGAGYYSKQYGHSPSELPSREKLLVMSKKATLRTDFIALASLALERDEEME